MATAGLWLLAAIALSADPPLISPGAPGDPPRALTPAESVALGEGRYTEADVAFMQDMIVHHAQAVEMVALIEARTRTTSIRLTGERIAASQSSEIDLMRGWLIARGHPIHRAGSMHDHHPPEHGQHGRKMHDHDPSDTPVMHGMLSPRQMRDLARAKGKAFDRRFLAGMIQHHEGALHMVQMLMSEPGNGEDPTLSEFLSGVVADQSAEILRMRLLLNDLPTP